jgi:hypothetical protein
VGLFKTSDRFFGVVPKSAGKEAVKDLGRKTLRTGGNIIKDIAENSPTQTRHNLKTRDCLYTEYNR